jgi:hypothetical protein
MAIEGKRLLKSGDLDDQTIAMNWPDRPAEITTGKRLRENLKRRRTP